MMSGSLFHHQGVGGGEIVGLNSVWAGESLADSMFAASTL